ncbi:hypothetical protein K440DRAFT_657719 [Wilcoxina mikolae CBS 423.85]|nr:hypothetical protein K440DRAFT_657719 [Wilcoxina mikolae CBS 423.85]
MRKSLLKIGAKIRPRRPTPPEPPTASVSNVNGAPETNNTTLPESAVDPASASPIASSLVAELGGVGSHTLDVTSVPSVVVSAPVSSPGVSVVPSLWKAAFEKLSEKDKQMFPSVSVDQPDYPMALLESTRKSRDLCKKNQWKFGFRGKIIIIRDLAEKVINWLEKFKAVGDMAIQYDTAHAAIPWSIVRFLLQVAVNDKETMGTVLIGVEKIAHLLVRCTAYEELYLRVVPKVTTHLNLEETLTELYTAVLEFLAGAKRYFESGPAVGLLSGMLDASGKKTLFEAIEDKELSLAREIAIAEAECRRNDHSDLRAKLQSFLNDLDEPIQRIDDNIASMYENLQDHHQNAKRGLLENTGQWLLEKKEFQEWRSSSASSILWLHGIRSIKAAVCPDTWSNVAKIDPEGIQKKENEGHASDHWNLQECQELICALLEIHAQTTILIDGLDEMYPDEREELLHELKEIIDSQASLVKVFLSSRDYEDTQRELEGMPNLYIKATDNMADIERFVEREAKVLIGKRSKILSDKGRLKEEIVSALMLKTDGMFQWADLQIKHLSRMKLESDIRTNLGNFPKTLEDMYERIYEDISSEPGSGPQSAIMGLRWVMVSGRPLTPTEWLRATSYSIGLHEDLPLSSMLDWCHNLVTEDKESNVMRFAHLSVQEYLETKDDFRISKAHSMAAQTCLSVLIDAAHSPPKSEELAKYAAIYWARHLDCSDGQHMRDCTLKLIRSFLGTPEKPAEPYCKYLEQAEALQLEYIESNTGISWVCSNRILKAWTANPLFAVSYFRFGEISQVVTTLLDRKADIRANGYCDADVLVAAANQGDAAVVKAIIDRDPNIKITNTVLYAAAAENYEYGLEIFRLLLDGAKSLKITQDLVIRSATYCACKGLLQLLLELDPDFRVTAETVLEAIKSGGTREGVELLLERYAGEITRDIIIAAACCYNALGLLELVIPRYPDSDGKMTNMHDDFLMLAKKSPSTLGVLLEKFPNTKIIESVLLALMRNDFVKPEVLERVLKHTANGEITEAVLIATVRSGWKVVKCMEVLLDRRPDIKITDSILKNATGNYHIRKEVTQFLLARNPDIKICESMLAGKANKDTVMLLLQRAPDMMISESTLAEVAKQGSVEIVKLLLEKVPSIKISESTLEVVAKRGSVNTVKLLLERAPSIKISESALADVAEWGSVETVELLLERMHSIKNSEPILVAAARGCRIRTMKLLLGRAPSIKITSTVLEAAAFSSQGTSVMRFLLSRDDNIQISNQVIIAALSNNNHWVEMVSLLLLKNLSIKVSESILVTDAANVPLDYNGAQQSDLSMMKRLLDKYASLDIVTSERVLIAVARNMNDAPELLRLLLCKAENIRAELRAKWATHGNLGATQSHLSKGSAIRISEPVVIEAVSNERFAIDIMKLLISKDPRIQITANIVKAARRNRSCGKDVMELLLNEANNFTAEAVEVAAYGTMEGYVVLKAAGYLKFGVIDEYS